MAHHRPTAGCREFRRFDRRELLRSGSVALAGLALRQVRAAAHDPGLRPRANSIRFSPLAGAPSHIDTFDPKPDAPPEVRGGFNPIATSAPGIPVTEVMPRISQVCV